MYNHMHTDISSSYRELGLAALDVFCVCAFCVFFLNPLQYSGVKRLYFEVFNAIQV